jgi:phosphoesterase RecJ-like protein
MQLAVNILILMNIHSSIFKKIVSAKNILVNAHKDPDYDSVASALTLKYALGKIGKKVNIVCCQKISPNFFFLNGADKIKSVEFKTFNFQSYDLFIIPDTASFDRVTGSKEVALPKDIDYIVIDHHKTNSFSYPLKFIDEESSSTTEVLYFLFNKWKVEIDKDLATLILAGILGDTVFLRYCGNRKRTMRVVADLVDMGADMDFIGENFYEKYDFDYVKMVSEFLARMKKEKKFVWSAVDYETYKKYHFPEGVREAVAGNFFKAIKDVDFGVALLEMKKGVVSISFRSKKNIDVIGFAKLFGGGGHKNAAGAIVEGEFKDVVKDAVRRIKMAVGGGRQVTENVI